MQLASVDVSSWLNDTLLAISFKLAAREVYKRLWLCFSSIICLHGYQAPDASKRVLLKQIRQSSVCLQAFSLKPGGFQRYNPEKKRMTNACHRPETAVWSPTFLVWYWKQKSETSRSSWKWLLLSKDERPDRQELFHMEISRMAEYSQR